MSKARRVRVANVYVPAKRRTMLDPSKVAELAKSMLDQGQNTPIMVREDGQRFVLIEGVHRLEACKALGEETILAFLVQGRRH